METKLSWQLCYFSKCGELLIIVITCFQDSNHYSDNFDFILVTKEIELLIKENLVDIALYSRKTLFNSCSLFSNIGQYLDATKTIKIASEWDLQKHTDVSVNRCPKPDGEEEETTFFMFIKNMNL